MTAKQIIAETAAKHSLPVDLLTVHRRGRSGQRDVVAARNEAMARCRIECGMPYTQIGRIFRRHHSSVIHGVRPLLPVDPTQESRVVRRVPLPPERSGAILIRQARTIGEQARQIAELAGEVERLRAAREDGQGELFAVRRTA
jgi:hypothetical protein